MAEASSSGAGGTPADVAAELHLPWGSLGQLIQECQQGDATIADVAAAYKAMDEKSKLKPRIKKYKEVAGSRISKAKKFIEMYMKNAVRVSEELQQLSHICEDGLLAAVKEIISNLRNKQHEIQGEIQTHVQEIMDLNHPASSSSSASGSAASKNYGKKLKAKNRQIKNMQDGYVQIGNRLTAFYKEFDKHIRPLLAKQPAGVMLLSRIDRVLSANTGSSRLSRQSVAEICDEFVGDEYSESDGDAAPKVIHVDTGGIGLENVQLSINDISGNDEDEDELGEDDDDFRSGSGSDNESIPDTNSQKMDYYAAEEAEQQAQAAEAKARAAKAKKALAQKKKKRERQEAASSSRSSSSSSGSARKKSRKDKNKSKSRR